MKPAPEPKANLTAEDEARQRRAAKAIRGPAIFTEAIVKGMTSAEIALLLNDCFYDLVATERRLLFDPAYDAYRGKLRR